jgi:SAM-dependent methyltransferase
LNALIIKKKTRKSEELDMMIKLKINKEENLSGKTNPGYESEGRAISYGVTQKHIVSKWPFYNKIIEIIVEKFKNKEQLSFLDFGVGTGEFIEYFLDSKEIKRFKKIEIYGADLSEYMILSTKGMIDRRKEKFSTQNQPCININLTSGVNLVDREGKYYSELLSKDGGGSGFDFILAAQFEQYFPNSKESNLAKKIKGGFLTKKEFKEKCRDLLNKRGLYFSINDYCGETEAEHELLCYKWDRHVAKQLNDPLVLSEIKEKSEELFEKINHLCNKKELTVSVIKKLRMWRRQMCREEIGKFSAIFNEFKNVFGEDNVHEMQHPSSAHKNFYMLWGENAEG